jgi:hypothetical protein
MSDRMTSTGKDYWFAPIGEPDPAFGFQPSATLVHDDRTHRFVRFVFAAHAIGADAEAVATFLNDLKTPQTRSQQQPECF